MTDENEENKQDDGGEIAKKPRRLLVALGRPLAAVVLGIIMGVVCSALPESLRTPCEVVSHLLPSACGLEGTQ